MDSGNSFSKGNEMQIMDAVYIISATILNVLFIFLVGTQMPVLAAIMAVVSPLILLHYLSAE